MQKSFLQSKEWMEFQKSLGRRVFSLGEGQPISGNLVRHDGGLGKNYLYIPRGPVAEFELMQGAPPAGGKNPARQFVAQLRELARQEESIFIKAEPASGTVAELLVENGFRRSNKEVTPHKTVIIDLTKSEEELLAAMHHKTRYNIKVAEKHGVTVEDSDDIDAFWQLLQKTTKRDKFHPHPKGYYQKLFEFFGSTHSANSGQASSPQADEEGHIKVELVLAFHDKKPVAGAVVLLYGDTAYYIYGASDHGFRSIMAPYLLHWENIKYLKQHGYKTYDLWGIDSAKWPGVTRFKLGWLAQPPRAGAGGGIVTYPGSFDLPIRRGWYLVYKTYRKFFK